MIFMSIFDMVCNVGYTVRLSEFSMTFYDILQTPKT